MHISVTETDSMKIKSCERDSNCVTVRNPSPGHCPMGLGKSLYCAGWKKMAGGGVEVDDQTVYCNAQRTSDERKQLIRVAI